MDGMREAFAGALRRTEKEQRNGASQALASHSSAAEMPYYSAAYFFAPDAEVDCVPVPDVPGYVIPTSCVLGEVPYGVSDHGAHLLDYDIFNHERYGLRAGFASSIVSIGLSPAASYSFPSADKLWSFAQMGARSALGCLFTSAEVSHYIPVSSSRRSYAFRGRHALRAHAAGAFGSSPGIGTKSWRPSPLGVSSTRGGAARLRTRPHSNFAEEENVSPDLICDRVIKIALLCILLQKGGHFNSLSSDSMPILPPLKAPTLVELKKDDKQKLKDIFSLLLLGASIFIGSSPKRMKFLVSFLDDCMKSYKVLREIASLVLTFPK